MFFAKSASVPTPSRAGSLGKLCLVFVTNLHLGHCAPVRAVTTKRLGRIAKAPILGLPEVDACMFAVPDFENDIDAFGEYILPKLESRKA